ncbi:hypothetical protein PF011_g13954 [Phytophthora fragariae]|uniref:Uncharacterized protein n=1 Tax=Phytophthora fragariae TaxID=53985 RepID=A0A6A3K0B1_9STRA|nr:hypothetical protein PF011_g13954 [Phytophthora fragariae]
MSLQDLAPENTKRAQATVVNVFTAFLASKNVTHEFIRATLLADVSGSVLVKLLDRFAMHLAFARGRSGDLRKRNTVMSYYRNVKNWLLEDFPQHRHIVEQRLLKMGRILERHCLKRQQGGMVTKAPACTKADLRSLIDGLYFDASSAKEYQDAALLSIMWYALGRASDLAFIQKRNLSVGSGNVLFLRQIRAKTSEEQGLSLFPDKSSFIMCPLHAIAMALAMQTFPVSSVLDLDHLSGLNVGDEAPATKATPLTDALVCCSDDDEPANATPEATSPRRKSTPLKMQRYVNRVLKAASARQADAGVSTGLSSHSFRRGGAQHANADASLRPQWIFDRGSWNMTATNKAFVYVFNTTNEDRKVSKVLSGWKSNDNPTIPSAATFDSAATTKSRRLDRILFASSLDLGDASLIVNDEVADLLVASLIQHFPEVNERYPMSPYTSRMRMCLFPLQVSMPELLGWSVELKRQASEVREEDKNLHT